MNMIFKKLIILLLAVLFTGRAFSQTAPNISYASPQVYVAGSAIAPLVVSNSGGAAAVNGQTSTFAGSGTAGSTNGTGTAATFNNPSGIVVDASGNMYVTDGTGNRIRKITATGVVSTFAGSGATGSADGTGTAATFSHPTGLTMDASGNIYVADYNNNKIRKITSAGVVSTFAGSGTTGSTDGTGTAASFHQPSGVAADASGNIYVADYLNNLIRKITPAGVVSTFAGSGAAGSANGTGTAASFNHPFALATDNSGNVYVADRFNNMVREITPAGAVTTLAGSTTAGLVNATGTSARFSAPVGVTADAAGNVYVADYNNNVIRMINSSGAVTTLSGTGSTTPADGPGASAAFNGPYALDADASGTLWVAEYGGNTVRAVLTTPFTVSPKLSAGLAMNTSTGTISGTPTGVSAAVNYTVTAYNLYGNDAATVSIEVDPGGTVNPSPSLNYITAYTPRIAGLITSTGLDSASTDKTKIQIAVQYFDGLGRPIQTVQVKASPTGHDIVQPVVYDQFGRETVKYLPYTITGSLANDGSYKPAAITDQATYYTTPPSGVTSTPFPYSETLLEASPIGRPLEQGAPGDNWQLTGKTGAVSPGHTVKTVYKTNNSTGFAADSVNAMRVARYDVTINANSNLSRTLTPHGYYSPNQLDVTISKDENWVSGRAGTTETYTDKEGHVILKRIYNYSTAAVPVLSTYYLYDDLGNLAFVLPPAVTAADSALSISATKLNNLCYQYRYDTRNRLSQKKIPGKGWEYAVYNILDQPVATQDSLQRNANNWLFTKYDGLGRPVTTGIWNSGTSISQSALQTTLSAITTNLWETTGTTGYTNVAWPTLV